jgi:hypothetical protein
VLAQASRLNFSTRLFNLIVTNIPGPQIPLYVLGHKLEDLFPIAFLPQNHALAVAIMSYDGRVEYGLLADYDAVPDIDVIAQGIDEALAELLDTARSQASSGNGGPVRRPRGGAGRGGDGRSGLGGGSPSVLPATSSRPKPGPAGSSRAGRPRRRRPASKPPQG